MHPTATDELLKILNAANTVEELADYTAATSEQTPAKPFHQYVEELLHDKGISASQLIQKAQLQRTYGYQILSGAKNPGRDKVLAICLALSLTLEETQRALTLTKEGILYPKNRRDAVIIFALNKGFTVLETNDLLYNVEEDILT